jgi:hypothetical protein
MISRILAAALCVSFAGSVVWADTYSVVPESDTVVSSDLEQSVAFSVVFSPSVTTVVRGWSACVDLANMSGGAEDDFAISATEFGANAPLWLEGGEWVGSNPFGGDGVMAFDTGDWASGTSRTLSSGTGSALFVGEVTIPAGYIGTFDIVFVGGEMDNYVVNSSRSSFLPDLQSATITVQEMIIPEPAALAALLVGGALLTMGRRRR